MTKLLQNKPLIKFLGIALSILLVVALVPQISIAYGSKDDIADETALAETGENAATEGEEVAADGENAAPSEEGAESAEGDEAAEDEVVTIDGVEMVSHKVESLARRMRTQPRTASLRSLQKIRVRSLLV